MKKTPKITIIGGIAALLVFGIVGAGVAFGIKAFSNSMQDLEDKWGSLIGEEDPNTPPDESDTSHDSGNTAETIKYSLADGNVYFVVKQGVATDTQGVFRLGVGKEDLKPNTTYCIRWSFDPSYEDVPAFNISDTVDGVFTYKYQVSRDFNSTAVLQVFYDSKSDILNGTRKVTTNENGDIFFYFHDVYADSIEEVKIIKEEYLKHVNYFEIEEVTE